MKPRCTATFSGGHTISHAISHATPSHQKAYTANNVETPPAGKNQCGSASTMKEHPHYVLQGKRMGRTAGHCGMRCKGISPGIFIIIIIIILLCYHSCICIDNQIIL